MSLALESPHLQSAASLTQADSALPLSEAYAEILPHGLLRGQVVVCHGVAAYSIALGLVERAVTVGSWLAVVDLEQESPEAIAEFGIPFHRVIGVTTGDDPANVLSAVFDGFDVVLIPAHRYRGALVRRISQRIRAKGVTLIVIDDADEVGVRDAVSLGDVATCIGKELAGVLVVFSPDISPCRRQAVDHLDLFAQRCSCQPQLMCGSGTSTTRPVM